MWGLISFLIGIAYGWASPGRQDKSQILKTGFFVGLVLAVVLALVGYLTNTAPLGFSGGRSLVWLVVDVLIITLLFILGVWIGDMIEGRRTRRMA